MKTEGIKQTGIKCISERNGSYHYVHMYDSSEQVLVSNMLSPRGRLHKKVKKVPQGVPEILHPQVSDKREVTVRFTFDL